MRTLRHRDNVCEVGKRRVPHFLPQVEKLRKVMTELLKTPQKSLKKLTGYQVWYLHYYF